MATSTVQKPERLANFLAKNGVQPWRVDPLVRCGAITAARQGERLDLGVHLAETPLRKGDVVHVEDSLPSLCVPMMTIAANTLGRDYAVTGPPLGAGDEHLVYLTRLLRARPDTALLAENESLQGLVERIADAASITHPVRDLIVACHASMMGALVMPLKRGGVANIDFEDLEKAVADRTIAISREAVQPRPQGGGGFPQPVRFLIKGCGVGHAVPYLRKLKEALGLGGLVNVMATRFFHGSGYFSGPSGTASYEFLAYQFWAWSREALKGRGEVLDAFMARGWRDYEGKPITRARWEGWVPELKRYDREIYRPTRLTFSSKLAGRDLAALSFFSSQTESLPEGLVPVEEDPGRNKGEAAAQEARLDVMRKYAAKSPLLQESHEFPFYARLMYGNFDEYIDGFRWTFKFDAKKKALKCLGSRFLYTVHQPVTESGGSTLIHNVYPTRPAGPPRRMFDDGDRRFYVAV
jgi:hypothetical protein